MTLLEKNKKTNQNPQKPHHHNKTKKPTQNLSDPQQWVKRSND